MQRTTTLKMLLGTYVAAAFVPSCATGPPSSAPPWTATAEAMPAQRQLER